MDKIKCKKKIPFQIECLIWCNKNRIHKVVQCILIVAGDISFTERF